MGALKELRLDISYSSENKNLVKDFYVPCLARTVMYRRAVGYFTSYGLSFAAQGIASLFERGGKIRLVASPALEEEDIRAIEAGYRKREDVLRQVARRTFAEVTDQLISDRLNALSWLIASGSLDIRLALRVDEEGKLRRGIFHEKMGIFTDADGNNIAFAGSPNETAGGLIENFEAIDVFCSWNDPQGRVKEKIDRFERYWNDNTRGLKVVEFTDVAQEILSAFKKTERPHSDPAEDIRVPASKKHRPQLPGEIQLRDYQKEAINNWLKNNGRGTFKMATGTGKTITAMGIIVRLYERIRLKAVIVICPYRHLVSQWARECKRFGMNPIMAFESQQRWDNPLTALLYEVSVGRDTFVCVVTTNTTFAGSAFQQKLKYFPRETLLIADEVHNLGAEKLRESLPNDIELRLGLSATPERWFDDVGTQKLMDYFGPVLEPQLTLKDALKKGVLVPYRYYPIIIELTDDERVEYLELSAKIAIAWHGKELDEKNDALTALLIKRARLIAKAANKLGALRDLMNNMRHETHMLFYCGDGTVEDPETSEEMRHVDSVLRMLGHELGMRVAKYTAETALEEREDLRRRLDEGELQGLVAIRCLDEGVDIPSIKTAVILASSRNPRQFIQRRGRILRASPGKESARIFDMLVAPPIDAKESESERAMLRNELVRFAEFADLARNAGEARGKILHLQRAFDLMDI